MALAATLIGTQVGPVAADVDARWTMAYAASLGDMLDCYIDTRRADGVIAHPLFPVCFEWPAATAIRAQLRATMGPGEPARGVHATHHTILHRPIRPPLKVCTSAEVVGIEQRSAGAYETVRFAPVDESSAPVCTTYYGSLYRQVDVSGAGGAADLPKPPAATTIAARPRAEVQIPISAALAHIYTECARIWNPIHTDMAVAASAGLSGLILHGTATLALAVSAIVQREAAGAPEKVAEIHGRFGAMVLMPSDVVLRILAREQSAVGPVVFFEAISANGGRVIRDGVVVLRG